MKDEYRKPTLEIIGGVRDVTAQNGAPIATDVPMGTPANIPGGILGSR